MTAVPIAMAQAVPVSQVQSPTPPTAKQLHTTPLAAEQFLMSEATLNINHSILSRDFLLEHRGKDPSHVPHARAVPLTPPKTHAP